MEEQVGSSRTDSQETACACLHKAGGIFRVLVVLAFDGYETVTGANNLK